MQPARIREFSLENYKAFAQTERIELAPLTIVLGRNNAGKSALCRAPLFLLNALRSDAWTPFPLLLDGIHFGDRIQDVVFRGQVSGFSGSFHLDVDGTSYDLTIGGAEQYSMQDSARANFGQPLVTKLELRRTDQPIPSARLPKPTTDWESVRGQLAQFPALATVPGQLKLLSGLRATPLPSYRYLGGLPPDVGMAGGLAPQLLAHDFVAGGGDLLQSINEWLDQNLQVRLRMASTGHNQFQLLARSRGGSEANLADCGEGLGQILPVVVALTALPETTRPIGLYIVEQPEVHLHPFAHPAVAELFIAACRSPSAPWFLIETHSDNFLLRVRVAIAEGRLSRDAVRVYFVEEQGEAGSRVLPIHFDDQGTPDTWPKGVFAENLGEFRRLRAAATQQAAKDQPK